MEERNGKKENDLGIPRSELPVQFTAINDTGEIHPFFLCQLDCAALSLFRHCIMHEDKVFSQLCADSIYRI